MVLGAVLALSSAGAGAGVAAGRSPAGGVRAASLVQAGRQLTWSITLDHDFSGAAFSGAGRSLCLLLERTRSETIAGQLCVAPPRRRGERLALRFSRVTAAGVEPARAVPARITRSSHRELTASFTPASVGERYRALRWQIRSTATGGGCAAAGRDACTVLRPLTPALARLHTPVLAGCVARGRSLVFGGSPQRREIALTFDDGPWDDPPTLDFVDLLARDHVPATFFEIGDQIAAYDPTGGIERRMLADGDMIGDHTWTHPDMAALSPARQTSELELTADAIHRATGFTPCLWRPPYGSVDAPLDSLARGLGFLTIDWGIDPRDWALPGVGAIVRTVLETARDGGIVELHFGGGPRLQTLEALPTIISDLRARGYRFVNLAQMLGLRMIWR